MSLRKVNEDSFDENKPCLGDVQEESGVRRRRRHTSIGSPVHGTRELGHGRDGVVDVVLVQEQAEVEAEEVTFRVLRNKEFVKDTLMSLLSVLFY